MLLCSTAVFSEQADVDADVNMSADIDVGVYVDEVTEASVDAIEPVVKTEKTVKKKKDWTPTAVDFDWVQLTSNEWLKGEIKAMYQESLEFDSDKLDLLTIDWEDVNILRGYKESSVNIDGYGAVRGVLEITGDEVKVINSEETNTFDRSLLISFAPSGEREADLWTIKVTLGLDIKQGNTDQLDYTAKANAKRRTSNTRFILDYIGNISKTDGGGGDSFIETINNHRLSANFDYYKTRYFFYNPVFAELFKDSFLNIKLRQTVGTGLGYTLIDDGITEFSISGGPAFVKTKFVSVEDGENNSESTPALVVRTEYDTAITSNLDFIAKYNIQYGNDESGGYTHHAIATLESELTGKLDLDVSLIWDRVAKPTVDAAGIAPESDDFRLMVGVTYTY